jgi:hypothetical protein
MRGAPTIHGELLKLGIEVAQSTVSICMVSRRDRPLQTRKTFLCNHMEGIASIDLFVSPTIAFEQLFAFLVLGHRRRQLLWIAVTRNPTAEWLARQITEAFPWDSAAKYLVRDKDRAFGAAFKARVRAMGIRDRPTSFRSPWAHITLRRRPNFYNMSIRVLIPSVPNRNDLKSNEPEAPNSNARPPTQAT